MRSFGDRLRHAISFEIIGLLIVVPLGALVFGKPMVDIGAVGVVSAVIAATWVFVYNAGFDHAMQRLRGAGRGCRPFRASAGSRSRLSRIPALS